MSSSSGPVLIVVGVVIIAIGLLAWTGSLSWFGKLPGDIRYERGSTRVYAPFATMLIISIVLSLIAYFLRRR